MNGKRKIHPIFTVILVILAVVILAAGGFWFRVYVSEGESVKQEQVIMEMDLELIRARGFDPMIIVVRIRS